MFIGTYIGSAEIRRSSKAGELPVVWGFSPVSCLQYQTGKCVYLCVCVCVQTAVPTSDHWRRLQHTFRCFQTKTCHAAGRMKSFRKGHMTCWMLLIKKRLLSPLFCTKYLMSCRDIRCYNDIKQSGKYSLDFVQNFAENPPKYCCVVQMHGLEHMRHFSVILKWCCHFSTYLQGKYLRSIDRKYSYRECWCYVICIKRCFLGTNQWLLLHVLAVCL